MYLLLSLYFQLFWPIDLSSILRQFKEDSRNLPNACKGKMDQNTLRVKQRNGAAVTTLDSVSFRHRRILALLMTVHIERHGRG